MKQYCSPLPSEQRGYAPAPQPHTGACTGTADPGTRHGLPGRGGPGAHVATTAAEAFLKDHELSPRVNKDRCCGCGQCAAICPFDAVRMVPNEHGFFTAGVLRYSCVGCGGCVGCCPVTAMDLPYFGNRYLQEIVASTLGQEG